MIRYNAKGEYNVPFGRYQHLNTSLITQRHSVLLNKAKVYNADYTSIFEMANEDDFMFLSHSFQSITIRHGVESYVFVVLVFEIAAEGNHGGIVGSQIESR